MNLPLWGGLKPGPYAVGFRTTITTDYSRTYGHHAESGKRRHRPIFLAIWYPAAVTMDAVRLTYGDYIRVITNDSSYAMFAERMTAYLREKTLVYGIAADEDKVRSGDLNPWDYERLAEWEAFPMFAARDATPVGDRFPVLFYHPGNGGTYEDNSVLCEYLASHGYLVVSSGFPAEDASTLHVDGNLDRSLRDLSFLMNHIASDPQADINRVGIFGQSFGGQVGMIWTAQDNAPIDAIVSLDSTADYRTSDDPRYLPLTERLSPVENATTPMLLVAVQARTPNWKRWDFLTHTPRWYAATGYLNHNDFTSQGLIGTIQRLLRKNDADTAHTLRQRFDAVCALTHRFLDAYVKNDLEAFSSLTQRTRKPVLGTAPEAPFTLQHQPPTSQSS